MADLRETTLDSAKREASYLDAHLTDLQMSLPKRGGTDLQKAVRTTLPVYINRVRDLRRWLDTLEEENS